MSKGRLKKDIETLRRALLPRNTGDSELQRLLREYAKVDSETQKEDARWLGEWWRKQLTENK